MACLHAVNMFCLAVMTLHPSPHTSTFNMRQPRITTHTYGMYKHTTATALLAAVVHTPAKQFAAGLTTSSAS